MTSRTRNGKPSSTLKEGSVPFAKESAPPMTQIMTTKRSALLVRGRAFGVCSAADVTGVSYLGQLMMSRSYAERLLTSRPRLRTKSYSPANPHSWN